ncbi:hypothetical protein K435DRAFT_856085 [Dendrothele bispora CBS 962.96]|uniref:Uncharacterized protein n=1 Tax=Dendrothele bispora (strain CBS 962.96) TaxID=1314807 RepID=A0A4S8M9Y5_DENBC|nr:hypothetical protein K435DRAFT_856085 [Dendrothele bispora CBS 962.96]
MPESKYCCFCDVFFHGSTVHFFVHIPSVKITVLIDTLTYLRFPSSFPTPNQKRIIQVTASPLPDERAPGSGPSVLVNLAIGSVAGSGFEGRGMGTGSGCSYWGYWECKEDSGLDNTLEFEGYSKRHHFARRSSRWHNLTLSFKSLENPEVRSPHPPASMKSFLRRARKADLEEASPLEPPSRLYKEGRDLPMWIIASLAFSLISGGFCVAFGSLIRGHYLPPTPKFEASYDDLNHNLFLHLPTFGGEAIKLLFNLVFVKPCVFGFSRAHGNATMWQLASETDPQTGHPRLEFNSNPRFLTSSQQFKLGPTGLPANVIMAISLAITYAASQMILLDLQEDDPQPGEPNTVLSHFALSTLGVVILVQAFISIWAIRSTDIKTWNTSPFATAYIMSQEMALCPGKIPLQRRPGRCMRSLYDRYQDSEIGVKPENARASAWQSHPIFRTLTMWIWMLVGSGFYWGIVIIFMVQSGTPGTSRGSDWLPISLSPAASIRIFDLGWDGIAPTVGLVWSLAILVGFQGGIVTTALTCAQTIVDLACDQRMWMEILEGSDPNPHVLKKFSVSSYSYIIEIADPVYHWMFGLAISINANKGVQIRPVPIFWISVVGVLGVAFVTWELKHNPARKILLPATFGHLQTMVDLIDEWHDEMYWGDKSEAGFGHAGTSENQNSVKKIDTSKEYGGQACRICHPLQLESRGVQTSYLGCI